MSGGVSMDRRRFLTVTLAMSVAALATSSSAGEVALRHLMVLISTPAGTNLDAVGRALADVARSSVVGLAVDVENAETSRLALKQCWSAKGQADLLCALNGGVFYSALDEDDDTSRLIGDLALVGSLGSDRRALFVSTKSGIKTFDDLLAYGGPLIVPTANVTAGSHIDTLVIDGLTGARLKPVPGYKSAERKLALMSGEATACVGAIDTFQDLVDQGLLAPILRLNEAGAGAPYADKPLLKAVAKGRDAATLCELLDAVAATNNVVVAPPGLTEDQIKALADVFDAVAPKLNSYPGAKFNPSESTPGSRADVTSRFGALLKDREATAQAFRRVVACGQSLSDGGTCTVVG